MRRAQAELAESERQHRALIEELPLTAVVLSMAGEVLFANRTAATKLGAGEPDVLIGRSWPDLVHPDDRPRVVAQAEAGTAAPHLELRMTAGRGGWWIADSTGVNITFDGRPAALVVQRDITEQRRAEAMLAEAEHRERAILDGLTEAILLHDNTGRITFANDRAAQLFGEHESELLLGMHTDTWLTDAVDADGNPLGRGGLVGQTLQTGATSDGLEIRVDHEGTTRWLRASAIALCDVGSSHPTGVICSLADITQERRARQALAASEARYRGVIENLSEGLIVIGQDGRFLSANAAAQRILGRDAIELATTGLFHPSWVVLDEDGDPLAPEQMPAAITLATGEPRRGSVLGVRDAAWDVRWLSITTQCLVDDDVRHVVVLFSDITERRRAEAALAASQERFRLLTEHSSDLVVARDLQGRFTYVSPSALELLGYPPDQLEGSQCQDLVHPDDHACFVGQTEGRLTADEDARRMEMRLRHHDGHHRWFEAIWRPVADDTGRIVEIHGVARDVQDRKDAEDALAHLATHDALTGLPNRSLLMRRLSDVVAAPVPGRTAVLFLDLDRFKPVNDHYGHETGDELLCAVAERLNARLRPGDTVARVGGDEFVIVATDMVGDDDPRTLATRLEADLREPFELRAATVSIDVSIGIAEIDERHSVEELMAAADQDMYRVKRSRLHAREHPSAPEHTVTSTSPGGQYTK
ncbi:MAG TPA: PAS domain S-box protein [Acidimicrobiales bacterium]|nr:PAS domain S-box protein [Acidimicrobiales bacterium]